MWEKLPTGALASAKQTESAAKKPAKTIAGSSVSIKWLCHFVEFAFFTVSKADGREK